MDPLAVVVALIGLRGCSSRRLGPDSQMVQIHDSASTSARGCEHASGPSAVESAPELSRFRAQRAGSRTWRVSSGQRRVSVTLGGATRLRTTYPVVVPGSGSANDGADPSAVAQDVRSWVDDRGSVQSGGFSRHGSGVFLAALGWLRPTSHVGGLCSTGRMRLSDGQTHLAVVIRHPVRPSKSDY